MPSPKRYRKKPVEVEAIQWDGSGWSQAAIVTWSKGRIIGMRDSAFYLQVLHHDEKERADPGDWIIREGGVYSVYKPDTFLATYEPVEETCEETAIEKKLDAEFDAAIQQSEGIEGHRLKLSFDGGLRVELIHPESGCRPPTVCVHCAADLTDPEAKRCYDCKGIDPDADECWLTAWVDEQGDELIRGSVTLPAAVTWETDYPLFHLPAAPEPEEGSG